MSTLTVDTQWIVGEPHKGVQLAQQVANWVGQQTGWFPSESQQREIDSLYEEIRTKYEHGDQGYFVFATVIVDAVLSRLYPHLINYSEENNYRITSSREETLTPELSRVIVYTLDGVPSDTPPGEEGKPKPPEADNNPFPLPPEIDPSAVPIPPDSPVDPYGPEWPGTPYDPLDPLRREPSPYPPRLDQPNIPWQPGQKPNPDSPIQERPPYQFDQDRELPPVQFPPRGIEISIPYIPPETTEGEGVEIPSGGEITPPVEEPPPPKEQQGEELRDLLLAILQEIIRQGALNRTAIQDAVLALQGTIIETGVKQDGVIREAAELITDVLGNDIDATNYLLSDIKGIIEKAYGEQETERNSLADIIDRNLENIDSTLTFLEEGITAALHATLDGLVSGVEAITDALLFTGNQISEAVISSVTGFYDIYTTGINLLLNFMKDATDFDISEISKYICEFLTAIQNIRNDCGWLKTKTQ